MASFKGQRGMLKSADSNCYIRVRCCGSSSDVISMETVAAVMHPATIYGTSASLCASVSLLLCWRECHHVTPLPCCRNLLLTTPVTTFTRTRLLLL
jgi:hypothetical protein